MIEYVARSGPPEAMNCPGFICDICRKQIVGEGNTAWGSTIGHDQGTAHRQTPLHVTHKGSCLLAFEGWFEIAYPPTDGWMLFTDELTEFVRQLAHNLVNAFADDTEGTYHPHKLTLPGKETQ